MKNPDMHVEMSLIGLMILTIVCLLIGIYLGLLIQTKLILQSCGETGKWEFNSSVMHKTVKLNCFIPKEQE